MSYSDRLLNKGNLATRFSHRGRFSIVTTQLRGGIFSRALDYGCGDGLLLKQAFELGIVRSGIGVDVSQEMIDACASNFEPFPELECCRPEEMMSCIPLGSCDLLLCTETLEHIRDPQDLLDMMLQFCRRGAKVIISVPIEIGPALFFKQVGRYFANRQGNYGYERYGWRELCSAAIKLDIASFHSSHTDRSSVILGHKGFDYRRIKKLLQARIEIESEHFSPFPLAGALFNSTVIWVGRVRPPSSFDSDLDD